MNDNGSDHATVHGTIDRITFRNPDNGYSVMQVMLDDSTDRITAVGIAPHASVGSHVMIKGHFLVHPKFGRQITVESITETPPSSPEGIERYLSSGLIVGIGKRTAERLVKELGTTTLEAIKTDPEKVAKIPGVGRKKAELLHQALKQQSEFDQILRFLVEHRISPTLSAKIYERFKHKTIDIIQSDPYILAREIRGIGFHTADTIALNLGVLPASPQRLRAGISFALAAASDDGHCYLSHQSLLERARTLLGLESAEDLGEHIDDLLQEGDLVSFDGGIFLRHFDRAEDAVARFIALRSAPSAHTKIPREAIIDSLAEAERALGVHLSPEQRIAVESAAEFPFSIITGGPGCGKTTIIKALTLLFERVGLSFALAAPTGRAAQRMSQVCGCAASTIHRLLKYDPHSGGFVFNAKNTLPFEAIIIDEASMVDLLLARDLFAAISERCTVVLVGDKDQLPSVGPGRVFADLVGSREVRVVALSKLFRRATESAINTVAYMINIGDVPSIPTPDGVTKSDAYFIQRDDAEEAGRLIENLIADQIPKKFGFAGSDIAILTPSNRGPLGTLELNKRIQERINPRFSHSEDEILEIGEIEFRVGDRVCQRVNNYKIDPLGVFNGDMGTVMQINAETRSLSVELWDGRLIEYGRSDVGQLSLAYTVTVHRSQGMEVPCVVLALDNSHFTLLERQLVYTGVTRAKKLLIIVGSKRALAIAAKRAQTKKRCTMLSERISRLCTPAQPELIPWGE